MRVEFKVPRNFDSTKYQNTVTFQAFGPRSYDIGIKICEPTIIRQYLPVIVSAAIGAAFLGMLWIRAKKSYNG